MRFSSGPRLELEHGDQAGMTLVEMVIAMGMLVIFTAVVATVLSFTQQFFRQSERLDGSDTLLSNIGSNGLLVDQHELQLAMDALIAQLQQPAWSVDRLAAIVNDPSRQCSYNPVVSWGMMGPALSLPPRYRICLRATSLTEPSVEQLLAGDPPGIYVLQALPDQLDASTLPSRQLFCRPRPFC